MNRYQSNFMAPTTVAVGLLISVFNASASEANWDDIAKVDQVKNCSAPIYSLNAFDRTYEQVYFESHEIDAPADVSLESHVQKFYQNLAGNQVSLDAESANVLFENRWDLYAD